MPFHIPPSEITKFPVNGQFPVRIQALDTLGEPAFYFVRKEDVNNDQYRTTLSIINSSAESITITGRHERRDYPHFLLRFRPGLVDKKMVWDMLPTPEEITTQLGEGWKLIHRVSETATGVIQVGLRYEGDAPTTWAAGASFDLPLRPVVGPPLSGSFFLKIELEYTHLNGTVPIHGHFNKRLLNLAVVDNSGNALLPIQPMVEGANTLLNDGQSDNAFKIILRNHMINSSVPFRANTIDHESGSVITVSIPYYTNTGGDSINNHPSVIGVQDDLAGANLRIKAKPATSNQDGFSNPEISWSENIELIDEIEGWKVWKIAPPTDFANWYLNNVISTNANSVQVNDGAILEYLRFEFTNIKSSGPNGLTPIYFHFHHLPGYADHTLVATLEKSPLVMRGDKVGIGTANPAANLEVDGQVKIAGPSNNINLAVGGKVKIEGGDNSTNLEVVGNTKLEYLEMHSAYPYIEFKDTDKIEGTNDEPSLWRMGVYGEANHFQIQENLDGLNPKLVIKAGGNVGIGVPEPTAKLEVDGKVKIAGPSNNTNLEVNGKVKIAGDYNSLNLEVAGNTNLEFLEIHSPYPYIKFTDTDKVEGTGATPSHWRMGVYGEENRFQIQENLDGLNPKLVIKAGGNVGIGTSNPNKAKLQVEGTGPPYDPPGAAKRRYSAYFSGWITAEGHDARSDRRIKHILGPSDAQQDLQILRKIQVTDYKMKDKSLPETTYKKAIAQQLAEVYPNAVSSISDAIPDIQQTAKVQEGWVSLTHTLKPGERVKLVVDGQAAVYEVLECNTDGFRVALPAAVNQVFVYGREVDDFHLVDYTAVAMLNVSATQALLDKVEAMDARIKQLEKLLQKQEVH